jgi:ATP adenylyltransferase
VDFVVAKPFSITSLPYANHVIRFPTSLPTSSSTDQLSTLVQSFLALLDLSITTIRNQPSHSHTPGPNSYNVLLTLHHLHMIPRLQEKHKLRETGEEMSVNAVGFAGMLLVKSEEELEAVRKEGVANILKGIAMQAVGLNLAEPHLIDLDTVS